MNNSYYNNNGIGQPLYSGSIVTPNQTTAPNAASENDVYIETVLFRTTPVRAKIYATFPDSIEFRDRIFDGVIEGSGRDHVIMSLQNQSDWVLIPMIYIDYVDFEEDISKYLRK